MKGILLDTCAAIWLTSPGGLTPQAVAEIAAADADGHGVLVSPITAWEVGMLVAKGRLNLSIDPTTWFSELLRGGVGLAPMPPEVLVAASFLPQAKEITDPADRIIASTARAYGLRIMTSDGPLSDYAAAGHLQAIAC